MFRISPSPAYGLETIPSKDVTPRTNQQAQRTGRLRLDARRSRKLGLPSPHEPADHYPKTDARRHRRYDGFDRMPLQPLRRIVKELFCRIAGLFRDPPRGS